MRIDVKESKLESGGIGFVLEFVPANEHEHSLLDSLLEKQCVIAASPRHAQNTLRMGFAITGAQAALDAGDPPLDAALAEVENEGDLT